MVGVGGGGGPNKIVAHLRADCKVYPTAEANSIAQLASLMNYKIRTEGEVNRSLNTVSVATTVVDLGKQLLQYARDSDLKGVRNSLSRGAPFTSDWLGMSALHFAAMNDQYEICQVLLNGGINKDSKTKVDRTPLHLACYYGNQKIVDLLISKNCAINPRDMLRMTPLHWAVEKGHKTIVRLLLKHNADVTIVTKFGRTPLAIAVLTEQADLLEELEAARQAQANRKYTEAHEKETSDAVNSIMGLANDVIEEPESIRKIDRDQEEFATQIRDFGDVKMSDLENIKETGIIGESTLNLLKSHGISMMPDDDTSKDMLNTALQNGRQLILSEGGKLLLNETKKIQNNNNIHNINNGLNSNNKIVPIRVRNESTSSYAANTVSTASSSSSSPSRTSNVSTLNKTKSNVITKVKDNSNIAKNKNIRIISLNDFKKLYGNTNIKTMQKIPPTIASQRNPQIRPQLQTKPQQVRVQINNDNLIEEDDLTQMVQFDGQEAQVRIESESNTILKSSPVAQQQQHQQTAIPNLSSKQPVRLVQAKRVEHIVSAGNQQVRNIVQQQQTLPTQTTKLNTYKPVQNQETKSSSVIPLLTTPEICRQLLELRKQNEELRRKFDLAQKEKEEMRQRLERLEELLLVERTDGVGAVGIDDDVDDDINNS